MPWRRVTRVASIPTIDGLGLKQETWLPACSVLLRYSQVKSPEEISSDSLFGASSPSCFVLLRSGPCFSPKTALERECSGIWEVQLSRVPESL